MLNSRGICSTPLNLIPIKAEVSARFSINTSFCIRVHISAFPHILDQVNNTSTEPIAQLTDKLFRRSINQSSPYGI